MKNFHYLCRKSGTIIRITARVKPRERASTWVAQEYSPPPQEKWVMPAFPEIGWGKLSGMEYLGSFEIKK